MRFGTLSVLILTIVALPLASAQNPLEVTSSLQVTGLPAEVSGLASNATVQVPFKVEYRVNGGFLCPQAVEVPVTIALNQGGQAAFLTASVEPAEGSLTISQGPHQGFTGSVDGTLTVALTEVTANASVPLTVTASTGAVSCQPGIPAASAEATTFANVTFTPPPAPTPEPPAESPGPGAVAGILAATVAAAILGRRRRA